MKAHKIARIAIVLVSLGMLVLRLTEPDLVPHVQAAGDELLLLVGLLFVHKLGADGQADLAAAKDALDAPKVPRIPPLPVLLLGVFVVAVAPVACTKEQGQAIQTASGPIAQGAVDGFACVANIATAIAGPVDLVSIASACSRFGIDVAGVYSIVSSLLKQHQAAVMADAGLPDVAASLAPDPLTVHLVAILASGSSGK